MVTKTRARSGADKLARRMQILEAALELWEQTGYQALTMSQVAEKLQLAKGTLYLYFPSKEELFLAIYIQLLDEWFVRAETRIQDLRSVTPVAISKALVDLLLDRPHLARLIPLISPVIERNVSEEAGRSYKEWLLTKVSVLGELIEDRLPGLSPGTGNDSLIYFHALAAGLHPMEDPSPTLRTVIDDPALTALKVEFGAALQHGFATMLAGFQRNVR